jgi:hypothetical protein
MMSTQQNHVNTTLGDIICRKDYSYSLCFFLLLFLSSCYKNRLRLAAAGRCILMEMSP